MGLKIFFIANAGNAHIIKLSERLADCGIKLFIFSLTEFQPDLIFNSENIQTYSANINKSLYAKKSGSFRKLFYLRYFRKLMSKIREFQPDVLHAHFASSNGLLGSLTGFKPFIISVWGEDIFSFPKKSILKKKLLSFILNRADKVLSTSNFMKKETEKYFRREIIVTPFGVDTERFSPGKLNRIFPKDCFVIGTVKHLEKIYGIDGLIKAFAIVKKELPECRLLLVGAGQEEYSLKKLAAELSLSDDIVFTGRVKFDEIEKYHQEMDIEVFNSVRESFGVSALEAMACGKPVILSDAGGFREITPAENSENIVPHGDSEAIAEKIIALFRDKKKYQLLSNIGRKMVMANYDLKNQIRDFVNIYSDVI